MAIVKIVGYRLADVGDTMGRLTLDQQKAKLEAQKAQLEARLKKISAKTVAKKRKLDTRRKVLVGALVLNAANTEAGVRAVVLKLLQSAPRRDQDRGVIESLIAELEAPICEAAVSVTTEQDVRS